MLKKYFPIIIALLLLLVGGIFSKTTIKEYQEKLESKSKIISELNLVISDQSKVIKSHNIQKNIKKTTYIAVDGSKKIEELDMSFSILNESKESNKNINLNESKVEESSLKKEVKEKTIINPKTFFVGIGVNNDLKPMLHLEKIQGSFGLGAYFSKDLDNYGGYISIGF